MCELFEKKNMRSEISDMLPKIFEAIVIVLGQSKDQIEASHYKKEEEENFEIIKEENCYDNDDEVHLF